MADQLLVFLALAGGRVRIPSETAHVRTNVELLAAFGSDVHVVRESDGTYSLEASAHPALAVEGRVVAGKEYLPTGANTVYMGSHSHPQRDSPDWENPDFCPFCGAALTDGGVGFVDHIKDSPPCEERFESWRDQIADDVGGEWGG
ncbi:DUF7501 family protein [Haloarcula amylovorans]|uniref:DUF7501 family protein n=1 Tax=Haloarcula amylovorans TaxID=2562280 RepID=UPI001ADD9A94